MKNNFFGSGCGADSAVSLTSSHTLRYVLKNRETNQELFVVLIELVPTEEAKKEGVEDAKEKFEEVHGKEVEKDSKESELD